MVYFLFKYVIIEFSKLKLLNENLVNYIYYIFIIMKIFYYNIYYV